MTERLLTANQVAELLGTSIKTIRRYNADASANRIFPRPLQLPSPSGTRPLVRWRASDVYKFAGLESE